MLSSSAHRHSSIDLSFEEGFSFLEAERNDDSKQVTKLSEPHWLFDQDDGVNAFLPNSPSQSRTSRLTTDHTPSYAQQTFTSSIASCKRQELGYTSPAIDRSAPLSSPARRIQATPPSFRNDYTTKTFTPPMNRKRKRSLASSPYESTTQTNALEEIVENALSSEEPFVPLSERLRRYEEEVEEKSVGQSPDKRSVQSLHSARASPTHLESVLPVKTDSLYAMREPMRSMQRSPDHIGNVLSRTSPINSRRSFILQNDHALDWTADTGKAQPVFAHTSYNTVPEAPVANHTSNFGFEKTQLRVIDDIPPMPESKPRRKTMSEKSRSQNAPPQSLSRTIPQPFTFATDVRGEQHQRQFQEKLKQWREREQAPHKFTPAGPPPRFDRPFQVKRSTKPLTEAQNVVFHSEIRSLERKMAEDERRLQEQLSVTMGRKRRRTADMERHRNSQWPSHRTDSFSSTRRSTKVLTTPKSPNFSLTRSERRAMREGHSHLT